jgi:hypothetical protein
MRSQNCEKRLSFVMPVTSVRMEQLGSHGTDIHDISYLSIFRETAEKIQFSLKSDKNNGCTMSNINF